MKRKFLWILIISLFLVTGCGNKNLNLDKVYTNLEKEYQDYAKIDNDTLEGVYGVDTSVFKDVLVVMAEDTTSAKMYAIFEVKDNYEDALYEAEYFVSQYKESWLNGYFPKEEALVKNGELNTYGNYIIYVVNDDIDNIMDLIKSS